MITVTGTEETTRRLLEIGADAPKASTRAINKTLAELKTAVVRIVTLETGITRRAFLGTKKAPTDYLRERRATYTRQIAELGVSPLRIPLGALKPRQTARGVGYTLPGGRGFVPGAFLATLRSGHVGVYHRAVPGERQTRGRAGRTFNLPIIEQFGPSPGRIIQRHMNDLTSRGDAALMKHMAHEIDWIIQQRVASGDE
jgi:hypothetical protein